MSTKYRTIVADPPWPYRDTFGSITHGGKGPVLRKQLPYEPMEIESIAAIVIPSDVDSRLFLWTTNRFLFSAFDVLKAWGFAYRQTLIWRKTGNPSPMGGSVAPIHQEFLLVATRGRPERLSRLTSSVIEAPAPVFGHSAKPELFLDLVEQISPAPRLEMFARRARFGWDYFGDESLQTVELEGAA